MSKLYWLALGVIVASLAFGARPVTAQKVEVSVLYRQDSDTSYLAVIPGYSDPGSDGNGACLLDPNPADCPAPNRSTASIPTLVGTTLSLLLPDGRVAVVNCVNRYSEKGNYINRRGCGMPMVEHVEAEFHGDSAKLWWPVGQDGRIESEKYRVVALLDKRIESAHAEGTSSH
jgi:hypothetical protein